MSNVTVIDDSLVDLGTGRAVPQIVYNPAQWWRSDTACDACDVNNAVALNLLRRTAKGGTWTAAGYQRDEPILSATLDFQGTSAAVYMIFFRRALDPTSTGPANLTFYINGAVRNASAVRPEDYAFNSNNFTPRMQVFRVSDLDPNIFHSLQIQWTHGGVTRPAVVVTLDYIEFTPSVNGGSAVTPAPSTFSNTVTPVPSTLSTTTKIVVGVLVPAVVILALAVGFLILKRRRRKPLEINLSNPAVPAEGVPDYQRLGQGYHIEPFSLGFNTRGESPLTAQTEDMSSASPISGSLGVHPPSYLESLDPPGGRFVPTVKSRS